MVDTVSIDSCSSKFKESRNPVRSHRFPDPYFCSRYQISPYRGCAHGCVYCDGRAEKYYVEGDFEKDLEVRSELPDLLVKNIHKIRERGFVSLGSGVTDVYQPSEETHRLTRKIGEILLEYRIPALVATKSSLILRDLDLWKELDRTAGFILMVSLSTLDEQVRQIFEPGASSVDDRLEVVRRFRGEGCAAGIFAMPLLPGISDGSAGNPLDFPEDLDPVCVLPGALTLRPGRQKELYSRTLEKAFPEQSEFCRNLYRENRASGVPLKAYQERLYEGVLSKLDARGTAPLIPHRYWRRGVSRADEIYLLLQHINLLYGYRSVDTARVREAIGRYEEWIRTIRTDFNRRRSLNRSYLDELIELSVRNDSLYEVLKNRKLTDFIRRVIEEGKTFDYLRLTLTD